jgi:hypothetical protein
MTRPIRSGLVGDPPSTAKPLAVRGLVVRGLVVRSLQGTRLVGPVSFTAAPGEVTLLTGADPVARWALASAVKGRLPPERMKMGGTVSVGRLTTPPLIRNTAALAQSWRVRGVVDPADRRLAALAWASDLPVELILLSPGLDGLDEHGRRLVLEAANRVAESGPVVVVTAPVAAAGPAERDLATVTITLPQEHRSQPAA